MAVLTPETGIDILSSNFSSLGFKFKTEVHAILYYLSLAFTEENDC